MTVDEVCILRGKSELQKLLLGRICSDSNQIRFWIKNEFSTFNFVALSTIRDKNDFLGTG